MELGVLMRCRAALCPLVVLALAGLPAQPADRKPNVIVVFVDDLGYADLGVQGVVDDIRTPHIDALAGAGVRFTDGYITAPQCSPSRAGFLTGRYQQRFGFDTIPDCPLPIDQATVADRMRTLGYATGMVGKWHLEPNVVSHQWLADNLTPAQRNAGERPRIPFDKMLPYFPGGRGFDDYFKGEINRYYTNYTLDGDDAEPGFRNVDGYRLDIQTDAALAFIDRHADDPFFLYLAYFAPHVPLDATPKYLDRFPGEMPERRRMCLAMMSAVDDGVGRIVERLAEHGLTQDTIVVFTSDNGAPIKIHKEDRSLAWKGGAWDGSLNDPLNGEKGDLIEGGIRVPFVMAWPGTIPAGQVVAMPVIALDVIATSVIAGGGSLQNEDLDGIDLLPHLTDPAHPPANRALYWRFWNQAAIREGDWKLLRLSDGTAYLFDLGQDIGETTNLIEQHPAVVDRLNTKLEAWMDELKPAGMPTAPLNKQERDRYGAYLGWTPK